MFSQDNLTLNEWKVKTEVIQGLKQLFLTEVQTFQT